MRILVVEDEADLGMFVSEALQHEGHAVEHATTARAALTAVRAHPPHLVVLDLMLPDQDGLTVLTEIRGLDASLPVLVVSARGNVADRCSPWIWEPTTT